MSYCVNCGVELGKAEQRCPLCGTEVVNPKEPYDPKAKRLYPRQLDSPLASLQGRRIAALVMTLLFFFAGGMCIFLNAVYAGEVTWAYYPAGALCMLWVFLFPPLMLRIKPAVTFLLSALLDALALGGFLWMCETLTDGAWFVPFALPVTGMVLGFLILNAALILTRMVKGAYIGVPVMLTVALLLVGLECIVDAYLSGTVSLTWSLYALVPCLILAGFFLFVGRYRTVKEELRRRLHM